MRDGTTLGEGKTACKVSGSGCPTEVRRRGFMAFVFSRLFPEF